MKKTIANQNRDGRLKLKRSVDTKKAMSDQVVNTNDNPVMQVRSVGGWMQCARVLVVQRVSASVRGVDSLHSALCVPEINVTVV